MILMVVQPPNTNRHRCFLTLVNFVLAAAPPTAPAGNAERCCAREKAKAGHEWTETTKRPEKQR